MSAALVILWLFFIVNTIVTWIFVTNAGCNLPGHLGISCPKSSPPPAKAPAPAPGPSTTSTYAVQMYSR